MKKKGHTQADKRVVREGQLERTLDKIFYNKKFIEEIAQFRADVGIPAGGFKTFAEYSKYLKKDLHGKHLFITKIVPKTFQMSYDYGPLPTIYAYWIEAFLALGFNYKEFFPETPYPSPREHFVYGASTTLDIQHMRDGYISMHIFPGATFNSIRDFLGEYRGFIESMLEVAAHKGKAPAVRKVNSRDRAQILELAEREEIDSTGVWLPGLEEAGMEVESKRPDCIKGIGTDQIRKIIAEEKRKKEIKEGKKRKR